MRPVPHRTRRPVLPIAGLGLVVVGLAFGAGHLLVSVTAPDKGATLPSADGATTVTRAPGPDTANTLVPLTIAPGTVTLPSSPSTTSAAGSTATTSETFTSTGGLPASARYTAGAAEVVAAGSSELMALAGAIPDAGGVLFTFGSTTASLRLPLGSSVPLDAGTATGPEGHPVEYLDASGSLWTGDACLVNLGVAEASIVAGTLACTLADPGGSTLDLSVGFVAVDDTVPTELSGPDAWQAGTATLGWSGALNGTANLSLSQTGLTQTGDLYVTVYEAEDTRLAFYLGITQASGLFASEDYTTDPVTLDLTVPDPDAPGSGSAWVPSGRFEDARCDGSMLRVEQAALAASFSCTLARPSAADDGSRLLLHGLVTAYG